MFQVHCAKLSARFSTAAPAARSFWEVLTRYPGIHALIFTAWRAWALAAALALVGTLCRPFFQVLHGNRNSSGATIGRRFFIDHGMGVVIGETASIGETTSPSTMASPWVGPPGTRAMAPDVGKRGSVGAGLRCWGNDRRGLERKSAPQRAVVTKDNAGGSDGGGEPARLR